jgi:hypothetical protein
MESILYYQDVLVIKSTEKERLLEAKKSLKKLSIRLLSTTYAISWYPLVAKLTGRPKISKILNVHFLLQRICRDINYRGDNSESIYLNNSERRDLIIEYLYMKKFVENLNNIAKKEADKSYLNNL